MSEGRAGPARDREHGGRLSWRAWLLLFLVAVGVYAPVLRGGFVWDDRAAFSAGLGELRSLGDFFSPPKSEGRANYSGHHFYPLTELTLKADQQLDTLLVDESVPALDPRRARVPHATTLLLHGVATLLVALFVWGLLEGLAHRDAGAFAAGLIFAVHPVHTESACFIVARTDVLATIFVLASILLAWRHRDGAGIWAAVASALCFGLALLSKELAATELLLLPLLYGGASREPRRRGWKLLAVLFAAVLAGYVLLRAAPGGPVRVALSVPPDQLPGRILAALAFYLGKVVAPVHASPYPVALPGPLQTGLTLSAAGLAAAGATLLYRRGDRIPLLAIVFFLVSIAPAFLVAISPDLSQTPLAERYLYLPSVGLAMLVGDGVARLLERAGWRRPVIAGIAVLAVAGAAASLSRTRIWQSDVGFWRFVVQDPAAARQPGPWYNLGGAYELEGRIEQSQEAYQRARKVSGGAGLRPAAMAESVFAGAIAAFRRGEYAVAEARAAQAEDILESAQHAEGAGPVPHADLARFGFLRAQAHQRATGQLDRATLERVLAHLQAALQRDPTNVAARRLLRPTRRALAAGRMQGSRGALP